ncbi:MAG: class I SAM-dependent methyltransferase [Candidatus Micrarchaeota archaeon]
MVYLMKFKPLSEWMAEKNSAYYKKAKPTIYDDFSTYAQSSKGLLSKANALAFCAYAGENNRKEYNIMEIGVGNGAFAYSFLEEIRKADSKILSKIKYFLADFSKPILSSAEKSVSKFKNYCEITKIEFDASNPSLPEEISFDLIRCNELFCDLPANLYSNIEGELWKVLFDNEMKTKLVAATSEDLDVLEQKLLFSLPQKYFISINRISANSILSLSNHLSEKGHIDIFDYGFYFKEDFSLPPEMWNPSIVREYGGQWTVDLNFLFLTSFLAANGKNANVQRQKKYVEKILGKKISLGGKNGLDYSEKEEEFEEEDYFYHMQVL